MPTTPPASTPTPALHPDWPEAIATVLACTYAPRTGRAIAFGLPAGKHFRITYNYWANGTLHTADFFSAKPIPQGSLFPIRYNPAAPHSSSHLPSPTATRRILFALALAALLVGLWIFVDIFHP